MENLWERTEEFPFSSQIHSQTTLLSYWAELLLLLSGAALQILSNWLITNYHATYQFLWNSQSLYLVEFCWIPLVSVVPMDPPKDGSNGVLIWSRSFVIILPFSSTINRLTKIWRIFSNIFQHIITAMDCGSLTQKQAIEYGKNTTWKVGPLSSLLGLRWP